MPGNHSVLLSLDVNHRMLLLKQGKITDRLSRILLTVGRLLNLLKPDELVYLKFIVFELYL